MQLGGTFLTLLFVFRAMRFLTGRIAIFDELARSASFQTTTVIAASGARRRNVIGGRAHIVFSAKK